jgi:WD40 repeat protein
VAQSHDGKRLITTSKNGIAQVWDFGSGRLLATWDVGYSRAFIVRFSHDDRHALIAQQSIPTKAQIWDVATGQRIAELEPDFDESIAFSPDGRSIALGSNARVRLWDIAEKRFLWTGNELPAAADAPGFVMGIRFSHDGSRIFAISYSNVALVLDAAGKEIARRTFADSGGLFGLALSKDGGTAVIGDTGKAARIWRVADDRVLPLVGHAGVVGEVALFADDHLALTASRDGTVKAWDVATGEMLGDVAIHGTAIDDLSLDAAGTSLVSGAENGLRRWRLALESRSAQQIAQILECRAPWKLDGEALIPAQIDTAECGP